MAAEPRSSNESSKSQGEETHKPARGSAGGRHAPGSLAEAKASHGDHSGDAGADRRQDGEASGEALRRQMNSPTIASVTTMVCITCGAEQFFDGDVPVGLKCPRCGSSVFRAFDTPTRRDEATIAHLEEEARSVQYGDSSPQTAPEEVRDLDMK